MEEDKLMSIVLDAGASDFNISGEVYEITTEPQDFEKVKKAVTDAGLKTESAEVTRIPQSTVKVAGLNEAKQVMAQLGPSYVAVRPDIFVGMVKGTVGVNVLKSF